MPLTTSCMSKLDNMITCIYMDHWGHQMFSEMENLILTAGCDAFTFFYLPEWARSESCFEGYIFSIKAIVHVNYLMLHYKAFCCNFMWYMSVFVFLSNACCVYFIEEQECLLSHNIDDSTLLGVSSVLGEVWFCCSYKLFNACNRLH